jgi:DNA-binding protein H-NS
MTSLADIQKKIDELLLQKKELISTQKAEIIATIKKQIADFEITAEELGLNTTVVIEREATKAKSKTPAKVKYRNPETGDTWSGRGRKPKWCQTIISEKGMEFFEQTYGVKE